MCEVVPEEAVLIRTPYLRNNIRASALLTEAKRRARNMTDRAENEAQLVYRRARHDGFAKGMFDAVDAIAQYLAGHAELASQLQTALEERVATLLGECVNNADVVMATFEECLDTKKSCPGIRMDLLLPVSFRTNHRHLLTNVQQYFSGTINIEYRDDARFLMRIGDQVAEFSPGDFVERASEQVMSALPPVYAESRAIAEACRERLAAIFSTTGEDSVVALSESCSQSSEKQ